LTVAADALSCFKPVSDAQGLTNTSVTRVTVVALSTLNRGVSPALMSSVVESVVDVSCAAA
jgi:hypothetical protein